MSFEDRDLHTKKIPDPPPGFINIGPGPVCAMRWPEIRRPTALVYYRHNWVTASQACAEGGGFYPDGLALTSKARPYAILDKMEEVLDILDGETRGSYVLRDSCRRMLKDYLDTNQGTSTEIPIYEL